jgi:hypothetical protein
VVKKVFVPNGVEVKEEGYRRLWGFRVALLTKQ